MQEILFQRGAVAGQGFLGVGILALAASMLLIVLFPSSIYFNPLSAVVFVYISGGMQTAPFKS